jgi:hypothetical protein
MHRYRFEEERIHFDREVGVRVPYTYGREDGAPGRYIYVIYDGQRGYYHPLAYVSVAADAQLIVDALNTVNDVSIL